MTEEDRSFLYGDGLFETVRVRDDGSVRWLDKHVARLRGSGKALGYPDEQLEHGVEALRSLSHREAGVWRVTVSRPGHGVAFGGEGSVLLRHRPWAPPARPRLTIARGFYLPGDFLAEHKTTSFMRYVEARRRAQQQGFDDAVLASGTGLVGEASAANIVAIVEGRAVTPAARGILPGVTREGLLELAAERGQPIEERELTLDELERADEVILLSAGLGALAAASLDERELGDAWAARFREWLP